MIQNLHSLFIHLTKTKTVIFIFVAVFLSLSGCSKIEYQQHCVPELKFELWENTQFALVKQTEEPRDFMKENGYEVDIALQIAREDFPENIHNVTHIQAEKLQLLGPVIRYVKPLFNPFSSTLIYFYANLGGHNVWIPYMQLIDLATAYTSQKNQDNLSLLMTGKFELFERSSSLQCVVSAHKLLSKK